jgi:hypothetical protein
MTLQDAIKFGKPFKRFGWAQYCLVQIENNRVAGALVYPANIKFVPTTEDMLACDYIVFDNQQAANEHIGWAEDLQEVA